jgi:hypothetical protein
LGLRLSGRLVPVQFEADQWGKPQTACIVEDTAPAQRPSAAKAFGKNQKLLVAKLRAHGPMTRQDAHEFMRSCEIGRSSRHAVIDGLLSTHVIEDTVLGLKTKE